MNVKLRNTMWRGGLAIVGATVGASLYFAVLSIKGVLFCAEGTMLNVWEVVSLPLLGVVVIPFAAPSVILFLLLETTCSTRFPKYLGFFLPVLVIGGGCSYEIWSLRSQWLLQGTSDGGYDIMVSFLWCYGVGICLTFACLLLARKRGQNNTRRSGDDERG